jgi:hypothetical protein
MHKTFLIVVLLAALLCLSGYANAAAIGVNRAEINFQNVLKGGYAQDFVTVSTDSDADLPVEYQISGDAAQWITIEPKQATPFIISRNHSMTFTIISQPPNDAQNGIYEANVRFVTGNFFTQNGRMGSSVKTAFRVRVLTEVSGKEIVSCVSGAYYIPDVETGYPIELYSTIDNTGNVKILPEINIDIWDQEQKNLILSKTLSPNERILPTVKQKLNNEFTAELPLGQYWADLTVPLCGDYSLLTFNVVEKGELSDQGSLLRIENKAWAVVQEIVPIAAIFRNDGSRIISAKFKGQVMLDNKIIKIIDTDALDILPGEIGKIETYFQPNQPGQYAIVGRVLYNNKLSYEKSSLLNVNSKMPTGNAIYGKIRPISYVPIIMVIGILVFLILIKKKKR